MAETGNAELIASTTGAEKNKKTKKAISGGAKKPKNKPTHPPTAQMVNNAIKTLKERGGSSLPAIKKYLTANYKVDAEKLAPFIKKYLKNAVASGKLIQTKGKGASGSFKLPSSAKVKNEGGNTGKKKTEKKKLEKKPKQKAANAKSERKKIEKKVEKKKSAVTTAKNSKKAGSPKVKPTKPKQQKQKKEKAAKATPKIPKSPKPKKLTAAKKTVTKKQAKK